MRYKTEATWHLEDDNPHVEAVFLVIETLAPEQEAHLRARGLLGVDDEPVSQLELGRLRIDDLMAMTEKRVRAAAFNWYLAHTGITENDSFELRIATKADLDVLERLEAAITR